jgi:ABC-type lipoprotein release transport system permease subunit
MGFTLRVAFRNVFRQRKRSFTLGVNYTVVTLILVLLFAFSAGAVRNITSNLVRSSAGHITISGQYTVSGRVYQGISGYPRVEAVAREALGNDITVLPRYVVNSALYYKGTSKRLQFTGIDTSVDSGIRDQIRFLEGSWADFTATDNGVVVPKDVAEYFGLRHDDEVVVSTRTRFGAFNTATLKIKGIYETDNFFIQSLVICRFAFLQALDLAGQDAATTMYLYLGNTTGLPEKRDRLVAALAANGFRASKPTSNAAAVDAVASASPSYAVDATGEDRVSLTLATIDEAVGIVKTVTAAVNAVGSLIALIMLFIIAVSIFINLRMTINERMREIGTMRTIGVQAAGVTSLFVLESTILALVFCLLGVALALLVIGVLAFAISLPVGGAFTLFLNRGHLVLVPRVADVAVIVAVITAFSALFSFFPARYGGRIRPVDALTRVY